ncbi:MAG: GDP-mannose 4,6-dehydratase [Sedimentisphaerales bacterium]|nr:GDP-mannose 4,6-dehydratase [Sedimentisphaerales bacterium]
MKALIFGAGGQDGFYLAEACRRRGMEVAGVSCISEKSGWILLGDVANTEFVAGLIRESRPELVFHLAAISTTGHAALYENHAAIGTGTINILEAVRKWSPASKVFITGSGLQFVNTGRPITETDTFDYTSSYVAVRNYSVYLARYFRSVGVRSYVGYLFHHDSPLRTEEHVSQKIVQAAKRIAEGSEEILELGDISVRKEWTFAADVTEAILTLVGQDKVFEATIGSRQVYSIEDWLNEVFGLIKKDWRRYVRQSRNFKAEYPVLISNPATINSLGWHATTSISELAKLMLNYEG